MSIIDERIQANDTYARSFQHENLAIPPARKLAVVACMDARLNIEEMLGLKTGEAHIIRNAGGVITEDVLRSLIISNSLLGTQEIMIINHTDCGMLTFKDSDLFTRLHQSTNHFSIVPAVFHSFTDLERNVRQQIQKIKSHPWLPANMPVRGFIYDVHTGRLKEVTTVV